MEILTVLGAVASVTASFLFYPQVWASYKAKKTDVLSWTMILLGMLNGVLWGVYGFLKSDPFILLTNVMIFIGASLLFLLKRKYG